MSEAHTVWHIDWEVQQERIDGARNRQIGQLKDTNLYKCHSHVTKNVGYC
jgi:hypothetical protein